MKKIETKHKQIMEVIINQQHEVTSMKKQLADLLVAISWADLSRTYFGKSSSWLYHKMDGRDGNGKPTAFTPDEIQLLKEALLDLSNRIRRAAEKI